MKKEVDNRRFISPDEAIALLPDGDDIHTFMNPGGMLIGCDISRAAIIKKFNEHPDKIEIGGETARRMKHAIIVIQENGPLFIANDAGKLNDFDPQP